MRTERLKTGDSRLIRLQKLLSAAGVASRRVAETLIQQGRVSVNGRTVTELGTRADPERDEVRVDGRRIHATVARQYVLLNKPRGYVTTRSDPQGRPTIMDLLAEQRVRGYLYPVGRLDFDSEGILLVTNDGDLAARLTHPRHGVDREYQARVRGVPDSRAIDRLRRGVLLDGRRTAPAEARVAATGRGGAQAILSITLREGRNRQVRRMCEVVGHPVIELRRVRFGPIKDANLRPGQSRALTDREVLALKSAGSRPTSGRPEPSRSDTIGRDRR